MGGVLSNQTQAKTVTDVPPTQTVVEEAKPSETVHTETIETVSHTDTDPVEEPVANSTGVTDNQNEVIERYVEKPGTKVEVAPVEVAATDDVVKKTKKKNKKNKSKQDDQN